MERKEVKKLVEHARAGDSDAARELYEEFTRPLSWHVVREIRRYHLAPNMVRDICQDVWLKAWEKLNQLREPNKFFPWIKRIASRRVNEIADKERERDLKFHFSTESKFFMHLDKGTVPKGLREEFESNGSSLSQNVTLKKIGSKWLVIDRENHQRYTVRKKRDKLFIYLPDMPDRPVSDNLIAVPPNAEQVVMAKEFAKILADVMASSLTPQQYDVFGLKLVVQAKPKEIAEILGIKFPNTVSVQFHEAKKRVISEIGKRCGYSENEALSEIVKAVRFCGNYLAELLTLDYQ